MKTPIQHLFVSLLLLLVPAVLFAQEKTQSYYNQHVNEILPDAREAFESGRYDRAIELCLWHYIIVGDKAADSLRERAEQCATLLKDMTDLYSSGRLDEAREKANVLLLNNANDPAAKEILKKLALQDTNASIDTLSVPEPQGAEELVTEIPVSEEKEMEITFQDTTRPASETPVQGISEPVFVSRSSNDNRTMFVLKAGVSALDLKNLGKGLAPGVSIGAYNLGGSIVGIEGGGYLCPDLLSSGSLFGMDLSLVLRIANGVYPKIGAGFFSFKGKSDGATATHGLNVGTGFTFLVGESVCIEIGVRYFPEICTDGVQTVSTTPGVSYEFPSIVQIIPGGIAPFLSLGWAF